MKVVRSSKSGMFITGAAKIVKAPSMSESRKRVASGSIAGDWKVVGDDLRTAARSVHGKFRVPA